MSQTSMTDFLDRSIDSIVDQSETQEAVNQSAESDGIGQTVNDGSARELPKQPTKKPERIQQKQNKKRAKLPRKCKEGKQSKNTCTNGHSGDDNIIHDRSLSDMLASAFEQTQNDSRSSAQDMSRTGVIIELEHVKDENVRLQHQIELLQTEFKQQQKTLKNQKSEIKRLTTDNDNLRRTLSKHRGIGKYIHKQSKSTDSHTQTQEPTLITGTEGVCDCGEQVEIMRAKLESLRDHIKNLAGSLLTTIDDVTDDSFKVVSYKKHVNRRCEQAETIAAKPPLQRAQSYAQAAGKRIPVVIGATADVTSWQGSNANTRPAGQGNVNKQITRQRPRRQSEDTVVIGTSLTRGLGSKMNKLGVSATTYTYAGTLIPHIRSRIPHILSKGAKPKQIVLQCGGNDTEKEDTQRVIQQYDMLIDDVKKQCPNVPVIVSTIPPRGNNDVTLRGIDTINTYLQNRAKRGDGVWCVDVVPKSPKMFRRDQVHFNGDGLNLFARGLANNLSNFSRPQQYPQS